MDEGGAVYFTIATVGSEFRTKAEWCPSRDEGEVSSLSVQYPSSNDEEDAPQIVPLHLPDPIMGGPLGADPGEKRGPASDTDSFELNYERISQSRFMTACQRARSRQGQAFGGPRKATQP